VSLASFAGAFGGGGGYQFGGASGPATSGNISGASGLSGSGPGGISSPVVIGGYKTDGSATAAASIPTWAYVGGALLVGLVLWKMFVKK